MYKRLLLLCLLISLNFFEVAHATSDPTKPFASEAASTITENKLVLQSIIHRDNVAMAIINGKVIKQGAALGQYQVAQINDDNVVLHSDDENIKLYIFKNKVLR
ncbi:hypothetical protein KO495_00290 [Colwellia sp. D2M02]|uniref:hypothetical protein n=1 Tax=Colwellia sp. D2M02 TaxID=2841562 RepID=UPI001C0A13CE|nr:hypothetical protein [Colwellia sp. D2M02]MBU2891755.1 hypothetical protein [Colwellia sp. D2M02]